MSCIITARTETASAKAHPHKLADAVFGKNRGGLELKRICNLAVANLFYRGLQKTEVRLLRISDLIAITTACICSRPHTKTAVSPAEHKTRRWER